MNQYAARSRSGGAVYGGSAMTAQPSIGAGVNTNFSVNGNATGSSLVLIVLTIGLVAFYVWTRGEQGGR